jgi:hypothetical protein
LRRGDVEAVDKDRKSTLEYEAQPGSVSADKDAKSALHYASSESNMLLISSLKDRQRSQLMRPRRPEILICESFLLLRIQPPALGEKRGGPKTKRIRKREYTRLARKRGKVCMIEYQMFRHL